MTDSAAAGMTLRHAMCTIQVILYNMGYGWWGAKSRAEFILGLQGQMNSGSGVDDQEAGPLYYSYELIKGDGIDHEAGIDLGSSDGASADDGAHSDDSATESESESESGGATARHGQGQPLSTARRPTERRVQHGAELRAPGSSRRPGSAERAVPEPPSRFAKRRPGTAGLGKAKPPPLKRARSSSGSRSTREREQARSEEDSDVEWGQTVHPDAATPVNGDTTQTRHQLRQALEKARRRDEKVRRREERRRQRTSKTGKGKAKAKGLRVSASPSRMRAPEPDYLVPAGRSQYPGWGWVPEQPDPAAAGPAVDDPPRRKSTSRKKKASSWKGLRAKRGPAWAQ